jgi:hypothetical protein
MIDEPAEQSPQKRSVITNRYDGPQDSSSVSRGINKLEVQWNKEEALVVGTLDNLLTQ